MGIIRGLPVDRAAGFAGCVVSSGLKTLEVTMNTDSAGEVLKIIKKTAGEKLMLGAGTVLTVDDLKEALDCGAGFIVLPTLVKEVVEQCVKKNVPVFPGALSPQEIYQAWLAGVFPQSFSGRLISKKLRDRLMR